MTASEPLSVFPHVIDSSMLSHYRSCRQKFFREYIQHWKLRGHNVHLHAGACYAHGLEIARRAFYEGGESSMAAEMAGAAALEEAWGDFVSPFDSPKTLERMLGALDFYFSRYPLDSDLAKPAKIVDRSGIEFSFVEPLPILHPVSGDPILFAGRADMIVDFCGGLYLEDDKTTSSLGSKWGNNWEMRGQFSGYCWAAQKIGIPVAGVLVRGVSILKNGYDTKEVVTYRTQMEIDRWYTQTLRDIEGMIAAWHSGYWDWNLDESCASFGGCSFMTACKSPDPLSWITSSHEQRVWNPEIRKEMPIEEYQLIWSEKNV